MKVDKHCLCTIGMAFSVHYMKYGGVCFSESYELFVQLLWLSGRALVAQARGVLGSTPSSYWPFHFLLFLPPNI